MRSGRLCIRLSYLLSFLNGLTVISKLSWECKANPGLHNLKKREIKKVRWWRSKLFNFPFTLNFSYFLLLICCLRFDARSIGCCLTFWVLKDSFLVMVFNFWSIFTWRKSWLNKKRINLFRMRYIFVFWILFAILISRVELYLLYWMWLIERERVRSRMVWWLDKGIILKIVFYFVWILHSNW